MPVSRNTESIAFLLCFKLIAISFAAREDESLTRIGLIIVPITWKSAATLTFLLLLLTYFWRWKGFKFNWCFNKLRWTSVRPLTHHLPTSTYLPNRHFGVYCKNKHCISPFQSDWWPSILGRVRHKRIDEFSHEFHHHKRYYTDSTQTTTKSWCLKSLMFCSNIPSSGIKDSVWLSNPDRCHLKPHLNLPSIRPYQHTVLCLIIPPCMWTPALHLGVSVLDFGCPNHMLH